MQPNDYEKLANLYNFITDFYHDSNRKYIIFEHRFTNEESDGYLGYFVRWLLDRKFVFEYRITEDRGMLLSVVSMAIGPTYFDVYDFWDYENASRFSLEVSDDKIIHNLKLIDEFIKNN